MAGASGVLDMLEFSKTQLIESVKKRPKLWDNSILDRQLKMELWRGVAKEVFHDWDQLGKAAAYDRILYVQKKWRSFRDAYSRELRARRTGTRLNKRVYKYFKKLLFLGGHEDLNLDVNSLDDGDSEVYSIAKKNTRKRKLKQEYSSENDEEESNMEEVELPMYDTVEEDHQEQEDRSEGEKDSDKLFLLSFLPEIKQLPLNLKMWARSQIAMVLQEAVNCQMKNSTPRSICFKKPRKDSSDSD